MKKMLKRLAICLTLMAVLTVSAFAADFTHCADALKDLGLFQGTSAGYQLDREPTRAEAATMLVRLLGQETAAKELTYSAPFTDVPVWAQPYVQYLFDKGLTAGKTATTFAPEENCSAQMFSTFLMRALGYSDKEGGQFTYNDAIVFATEKGVANSVNCDVENFLRDDVVAMSYTALATETATGDANLLQQLTKSGAIKDAKGFDKQFSAYRDYAKAAATEVTTKSHMKMDMTIAAKIAGTDYLSGTMNVDMLMDMNMEKLDSSKLSMIGKMDFKINPLILPTDNTMVGDIAYYYADGVYYMSMSGEKIKTPMSFDNMLAQMGDLTTQISAEPICMLNKIAVNGGTYTISYANGGLNSMLKSMMDVVKLPGTEDVPDMTFDKLDSVVKISNNKIVSQTMDMAVTMTVEGKPLTMEVKATTTDVGGTVNVVLPTDLNTYVEAPVA